MPATPLEPSVRSLLLGRSWPRTRRALALAAGLAAGTATLRAVAPGSPLHDCCHE